MVFIAISANSTGFCVGCKYLLTESFETSQTEPNLLPVKKLLRLKTNAISWSVK